MKIAIVIPCRNEVDNISECVNAIYASELPADCTLKVFVVDGLSHDGTVEKLQQLQKEFVSLTIVSNEKQQTPYAFNLGVKAGIDADYIQIVGARQILSSNYLKGALQTFADHENVWCVGGSVENVYLNEVGEIIANAMGTAFGMGLGNFRTLEASGYVDTVGTPMYPSWVFEKIGFFDEELVRNQDDDFNFRVEKAGGKIYFEQTISLKYYVRGSYSGLWRQFFQYGYWKVFVNKKHKAVTTIRQLIPPLFVLYLIGLIPTVLFGSWIFLFTNVPLMMYLLLSGVFSASTAKKPEHILALMKTYFILHVSYGLGYWRGIIDFLILGKKPSDSQKRLSR